MSIPTFRSAWWTLILLAGLARGQVTGINLNGASPNAKAVLDLDVSGTVPGNPFRGFLVPRMTAAQRLAIPVSTIAPADLSLLVYQTDDLPVADPSLVEANRRGYWYYSYVSPGSPLNQWVRWSGSASGWRLTGNANTVAGTHFIGTVAGSNDDLIIRTSSALALDPSVRISGTSGYVGINTSAAPVERMEVNGGVKLGNTLLNTIGAIRYENTALSPNRWHYGNIDGTATGWQRLENAETLQVNQAYREAVSQCGAATGSRVRGIYAGTPTATSIALGGQVNTPFATNTGAFNRQGLRVQYLFRASELLAAGLCPGLITQFSFYVIQNEPICTPLVNCPDLLIDVRMGNTTLNTFGPVVNSQPVAIGPPNEWDAFTEASGNIHVNAAQRMLTQTGWIDFPITGGGFNWTGGNLVIDFSWQRAASLGASPQVRHEVVAGFTCTKYVQVLTGANAAHGNTYQDNPLTAGAYTGTNSNRPITRFYGVVPSAVPSPVDQFASAINYGGGLIVDHNVNPTIWADGAYRGPGTVAASLAVYDGNLRVNDDVFDGYFDGERGTSAIVGLDALKEHLAQERHLPEMPGRSEWKERGVPSLGTLHNGLWRTWETHALYIGELDQRLQHLEAVALGGLQNELAITKATKEVERSKHLDEEQKRLLMQLLEQRRAELLQSATQPQQP